MNSSKLSITVIFFHVTIFLLCQEDTNSVSGQLFGKDYGDEVIESIEYFEGVLCGGEKHIDTTIILDDSSFIFNFYSDENRIIYNTFEFGLEMRYYFFDRNLQFGYLSEGGHIQTFYTDEKLNLVKQTIVSQDRTIQLLVKYKINSTELEEYIFIETPSQEILDMINFEKQIKYMTESLLDYSIILQDCSDK
jgi:hypothetical protein